MARFETMTRLEPMTTLETVTTMEPLTWLEPKSAWHSRPNLNYGHILTHVQKWTQDQCIIYIKYYNLITVPQTHERKNKYILIFPTYSSEKIGSLPRAAFKPTSPCILVRRVNHYTIRNHHVSNIDYWCVVRFVCEYPWYSIQGDMGSNSTRGKLSIFSDEYIGKIKTYLFFLSLIIRIFPSLQKFVFIWLRHIYK